MKVFFRGTRLKKAKALTVAFSFAFFTTSMQAKSSQSESYNVAAYRGEAGCPGCSEMVVKSLVATGLPLHISYVGEKEKLKSNAQTLKKFDLYVQPGGGQDIPGSYQALGDKGAEAIRNFVKSSKSFLGLCMGAHLADKDWIGLIDAPLGSEVGEPGPQTVDEGDCTLQLTWNSKQEPFYYQDGPYLNSSIPSTGFQLTAYYKNGDIVIGKCRYGKGNIILSGPHPEADETWIDSTAPGNMTVESKMQRISSYLNIKEG